MDIIKYNTKAPVSDSDIVEGFTSKMWIERYRDAGEFTLVAPVSSGVRDKLPLGTFISHMNTAEIMIVENHEIKDTKGSESEITITGRSWETFLENRVIATNKTVPMISSPPDGDDFYSLSADYTSSQVDTLINYHIQSSHLLDTSTAIPNYVTFVSVSDVYGMTSVARNVPRGTLYERIIEILAVDNLGIRTMRPGPGSVLGLSDTRMVIYIFRGIDRTSSVTFSWDKGDIVSADYLWSNKTSKTAAYVWGKWGEVLVNTGRVGPPPPESGYNRRVMNLEAKDIDQKYVQKDFDDFPATNLVIYEALAQRGADVLAPKKEIAITKIEMAKDIASFKYRRDFGIGDKVTVLGGYGVSTTMQIVEYVETEDASGESGYPTLIIP